MFLKLILFAFYLFIARIESLANININYTRCPEPGYEKWVTIDNDTCYYISNYYAAVTWHDATIICKQLGGKLPSIHSKLSNDLLVDLTREIYNSQYGITFWIGLNSLENRGFYKWSDGTPVEYTNLAIPPVPYGIRPIKNQEIYLQGRCVYLYNTYVNNTYYGYWYYDNCNNAFSYICEKNFSLSTSVPSVTPTPPGNCPLDWLQYADEKCIKVIDDGLMTWAQAKNRCNSLKGELLSIHSLEEQNYISSLLPDKTMPFIGLNRQSSTAGWSWDDESMITFSNWAMQSTVYYNYRCAVLMTNEIQTGRWLKVPCDSNHTAICEKPKNASITFTHPKTFPVCTIAGFEGNNLNFVQYRNSCYFLVDKLEEQRTWNDAEAACEMMNGAHLVSIVDPFEYAFLMYYLTQYAKFDQFWIGFYADGLTDANVSQVFKWTDNWPNYFTKWDQNQPQFVGETNKECVYQSKANGTWSIGDCVSKKSFICKTTLNQIPKMQSGLNGTCPKLNTTNKKLLWTDLDKRSQYCYWFSSDLLYGQGLASWADAAFQCKQRNGTLASIHSNHDLLLMKKKISDFKYNTWIGLYQTPLGQFVWDDKSPVDFTNWDENAAPDEDDDYDAPTISSYGDKCVEVKSMDLKWVANRCSSISSHKFYICQIPKTYESSINPLSKPSGSQPIGMSSGVEAGIILGVIVLVAVIFGSAIFAVKKLKRSAPNFRSYENSLYVSRRGHNFRPNGETVTSEPVVSWTGSENESLSIEQKK